MTRPLWPLPVPLQSREVDPVLPRHPAHERRRTPPEPILARRLPGVRADRFGLPAARRLLGRHLTGVLLNSVRCWKIVRSSRVRRRGRPSQCGGDVAVDIRDDGPDLDGFPLVDENFDEYARLRRGDLGVDLVG